MPTRSTVAVSMNSKKKSKKSKSKSKLQDLSVDEFLTADFDSDTGSSTKSLELKTKKVKGKNKTGTAKNGTPQTQKLKTKVDKDVTSTTKMQNKKMKTLNKDTDNSTNNVGDESSIQAIQTGPVSNKKPKPNKSKKGRTNKNQEDPKMSLAEELQENDPEFYDFLKGEDKDLLSNLQDLSDEDSDEEGDDNDGKVQSSLGDVEFEKEIINMSSGESDSENEDSGIHQLPGKLEVASDDSDVDDDDNEDAMSIEEDEDGETLPKKVKKPKGILITNGMINEWSENLKAKPSLAVVRQVVSAFHAAVQEAGGASETSNSKYRVEGSSIFNSIVRLCLQRIAPSLQKMLNLPTLTATSSKNITSLEKSGLWKKIKVLVKTYLTDILELLSQLSEAVMVNAILKHVHKLILFYTHFPKLSKMLLKRMIKMWTSGEETTRVLAFLCINKLVHLKQDSLLEPCLKQMYMAYVSNCKFTSPTTLPLINFMLTSLVEIFNIDQTVAYQYAFIYIRQLAIHLRNAISVKKKTTCQAVYNWQYIHCLSLWVKLITTTYPSEILEPMVYPLTQTIIGTIKLLPNSKYYPLRFHCVKLLNSLSAKTGTFIPTLPFLLEVLEQTDFNKRHKTLSMKPFNFAVILKFSKSQVQEKAFRDGLVDQLYELFLESIHNQSCSIGFPELIVPSVIQLKDFLKKCKIANYCKQFKQIVDKSMEQAKFIADKRKNCGVGLDDVAGISHWEQNLKSSGTPLDTYYASWRKLRDRELLHEVSRKDEISGAAVDIPVVERKLMKKATPKEREDLSKLFENESDSDDENRFLLKEERPDKVDKKRKRDAGSDSDDYSDFDSDELEQLAGSASDSEEEEDMEEGGAIYDDNAASSDEDAVSSDDEDAESSDDEEEVVPKKKSGQKNPHKKQKHSVAENIDAEIEKDDVLEDFKLSEFDSD